MYTIQNTSNSLKLDVPFDGWKLTGDEHTELIQFMLKPNEEIPSHVNPVRVFFFILNGTGTLTIEDKKLELAEGDSIRVEKDLNRTWENLGTHDLHVLVIKQTDH